MKSELPSAKDYASECARFSAQTVIDLQTIEAQVVEPYKNQVLLDINNDSMRLSVFEGLYRWHVHPDSDELFLVIAGELHIEFEDGAEAVLRPWQCLVVPAGTVHRTRAVERTVNVAFEKQNAEAIFVGSPANE